MNYQKLFDYMSKEHGVDLLETDIQEIERIVRESDKSGIDVILLNFPDNVEIWKWWQTQKLQKEQGEQEYKMIYEIDLPKILKSFVEYFRQNLKD
jgi:alkyl hydroperoxide reductase subunit AhpC